PTAPGGFFARQKEDVAPLRGGEREKRGGKGKREGERRRKEEEGGKGKEDARQRSGSERGEKRRREKWRKHEKQQDEKGDAEDGGGE
ncbi:hypothetical protein ACC711_39350, partial [Rhizobium ruizarguesonis]